MLPARASSSVLDGGTPVTVDDVRPACGHGVSPFGAGTYPAGRRRVDDMPVEHFASPRGRADGRQMALIDDQNIAVQYIGE